jgi:hypothetical protein
MKPIVTVSIVAVVALTGAVMADLAANEMPVITGSWWQEFTIEDEPVTALGTLLDGPHFDAMTIDMLQGQGLKPQEIFDVVPTPSQTLDIRSNPTSVEVAGDNLSMLGFKLHFAGSMDEPLSFVATVYDKVETETELTFMETGASVASWNGTEWSIEDYSSDLDPVGPAVPLPAVPLPGAVLLGLLGLSAAGAKLRHAA